MSAYRWSGTAVADEATAVITAVAVANNVRKFDVSFEHNSGDMFVGAMYTTTGAIAYGALSGTTWTITTNTTPDFAGSFIDLPEQAPTSPGEDDLIISTHGIAAGSNTTEGYGWSGSAITDGTAGDDAGANYVANGQFSAVSFFNSTYYGVAVISSTASGADDIEWWTMDSSTALADRTVNTRTRGAVRFLDLFDYPNSDKVLLITADANSDLWADTWNGSAVDGTAWVDLTSGGTLEGSLASATTDVVDFAFRFAPPQMGISGKVYSDEGVTELNNPGKTLKLRVGTSTPTIFSTTTDPGTGYFRFANLTGISTGTPLSLWFDNEPTFRAFAFTKASATLATTGFNNDITSFDLYKNVIRIKHEGVLSTTGTTTRNVDLGEYDYDDNASIRFTANSNNLETFEGQKLLVAYGTHYAPGGTVTTHSSSTALAPSGDFQLEERNSTSSMITLGGTLTVGGSYTASSSSVMNPATYGVLFTASSSGKLIMGELIGDSAFASTTFAGTNGSWTYRNNASTTGNFTITSGSVTAPSSGLLTIGGNYVNNIQNGTFIANNSTTTFSPTSYSVISGNATSSPFHHLSTSGSGTTTFASGMTASTTGNLMVDANTNFVSPSMMTVNGNVAVAGLLNTFASSTALYLGGTSFQSLSGNLIGSSSLASMNFLGVGAKTFTANASTTGNLTIKSTSGTVTAPSLMTVNGNYSNASTFTAGSGTLYLNGGGTQTLSGTMTGSSAFNNLTILNNSGGDASSSPSIVFENTSSTTGTFTATIASTSIRFPANATTSINNLILTGASASAPIFLRSSIGGTHAGLSVSGTRSITFADVKDSGACSGYSDITAITSINSGNNICWNFGVPIISLLHYRWRMDHESEVSAGYYVAEDTVLTNRIFLGDRLRLRTLLHNTGTAEATNFNYRLEYASSSCSSWTTVGNTVEWMPSLTTYVVDYSSTTDSGGLTNPGGATWREGVFRSASSTTLTHSLPVNYFTEHEFSISSSLFTTRGTTYCFRLTNSGSITNFVYTVQPQIVINTADRPESGGLSTEAVGSGPQRSGGGQSGGSGSEGNGSGAQRGGGGQGGGGDSG